METHIFHFHLVWNLNVVLTYSRTVLQKFWRQKFDNITSKNDMTNDVQKKWSPGGSDRSRGGPSQGPGRGSGGGKPAPGRVGLETNCTKCEVR